MRHASPFHLRGRSAHVAGRGNRDNYHRFLSLSFWTKGTWLKRCRGNSLSAVGSFKSAKDTSVVPALSLQSIGKTLNWIMPPSSKNEAGGLCLNISSPLSVAATPTSMTSSSPRAIRSAKIGARVDGGRDSKEFVSLRPPFVLTDNCLVVDSHIKDQIKLNSGGKVLCLCLRNDIAYWLLYIFGQYIQNVLFEGLGPCGGRPGEGDEIDLTKSICIFKRLASFDACGLEK